MWCEEHNIHIDVVGSRGKLWKKPNKRITCPKCKRRLLIFVRECHDPGCLHSWMPKHKIKTRIPKQKTRHERHR